jgi:HK97 family phage portal protein
MTYHYPKKEVAKKSKPETKAIAEQTRAVTITEKDLMVAALNAQGRSTDYVSDDPWSLPAFYNGVRQVASAIARTDCNVKKLDARGGKTIDKEHPAHTLLTHKANLSVNYFDFIRTIITHAIGYGDGFAFIDRLPNGDPTGFYNLDPTGVFESQTYVSGVLTSVQYEVTTTDAGIVTIPADDVIHIRNMAIGLDGAPVCAIHMMRQVVRKANAIQRFQTLYFTNGSHISKVVKIPGWLDDTQKEEIKNTLSWMNTGLENSHRIAILQGGTDITSLQLNAQDMELAVAGEGTLTDLANVVGIPGTRIGARGSISYGSLAQDNRLFQQDLDNWFTGYEAELNCKALRAKEQGETHIIEFNRESLLASDPEWQALQITKYKDGVITLDELRAKLGEPPAPDELKEPEPAPIVVAASAPEQTPLALAADAQPQEQMPAAEVDEDQTRSVAVSLSENILKRIKKRIMKSVEAGKYDLAEHAEVIAEELKGANSDIVFDQLNTMQTELDATENKVGVIKLWNTNQTALAICS